MNAFDLIGAAGAASLAERLSVVSDGDGIARFMLDRLTGPQVAAIVRALLQDHATESRMRIVVPRSLVAGQDLPESVVTDERTVALRHAECDRPALLIANTDDDQGASLQDVTLIGAKQLSENPAFWVGPAAHGLGLPDEQLRAWEAALRGLTAAEDWTLHQVSHYVELTRTCIEDHSMAVPAALGWALPALQLPRDSGYFLTLRTKDQDQPSRWKKLFEKLVSDRKPLLAKQRPSRQIIETDELRSLFDVVRDEVTAEAHPAVEAFIVAPPGWGPEVADLAEYEWEADNILQLFSGLRLKKTKLPEETSQFFEYEKPDRLSEADRTYLQVLRERSLKEPRDDDREFFESHLEDFASARALRAKWERFIYGRPIECTDFLEGLLRAIERLFGQTTNPGVRRELEIRTARKSRSQWLDLNADVGRAFALRYKGLNTLMGDRVTWETSHLFEYEALLEKASKLKKYRRNDSVSRQSLQIKFDIALTAGSGASAERTMVQLIWTSQPDAIGLELPDDLDRLAKRPFVRTQVARLPVSRKGALQSVSLSDVATLQPAFGQDSGSLVPRANVGEDVGKAFPKLLKAAVDTGRISVAGGAAIVDAWRRFSESYGEAIVAWRNQGVGSPALLSQAEDYGALLRQLTLHAAGDISRRDLWEPVLALGCVEISGAAPSALIAPWHPLRLAATAVKMRSLAGLTAHLLTANEVNFGDSRLFFADLRSELTHPYYPEIAVGYAGSEPVLLAETTTVNDYSLMERPVRDPSEAATDVDPSEAARQIRTLIERYLDLQPHERSNLSIMLYNCDAAGLPLATINALGSVQDQEEVHCNVLVRHRDRPKLSRVYSELLERSESDPDAVVVSETSRNFMSKLRIGVMLDGGVGSSSTEYRNVDVAFMHDVVSRQAKEAWFAIAPGAAEPSLLDHVPARWSYRRVTAEDELKATSYLACPRQPSVGWAYVDAVAGVVRRQSHPEGEHYLPARQISFQDHGLKSMFDEVHGLAEWVATYDDLLDKRQLAAQGIKVIRYRRQRTHGRNMVVSSTSELRILHVLVRRRLTELNLGIADDRLSDLARRMIDEAAEISGDIVLRAAKRGVSAGELIGLVLSRALVAEELGGDATIAWFLLDDYAEWLGQREEGIADILALSVTGGPDGAAQLRAVVTEAKYVETAGAAEASRKSKQQLRHTVQRIDDALFGDPGRLDRDLWLSRLADLLLDGTTALGKSAALEQVRDGIRRGSVRIDLRGYSHVFISGPADANAQPGEQEALPEISNGLQELYTREGLRQLIKAYDARVPLKGVRSLLGELHPWDTADFRSPAPRVNWTSPISKADNGSGLASQSPASRDQSGNTDRTGSDATTVVSDDNTIAPLVGKPTMPLEPSRSASDTTSAPEAASVEGAPIRVVPSPEVGFAALVRARAHQARADSVDEQAWLETTAQKLRTALLGYNLQAKITNTRLTPNAALIRFTGTDRLRVEDIEARQSALLTTHGLRLISVSPLPGEIVVGVARPQRQIVSLWDVWSRRATNRNTAGVNTSIVLGLRELDGEILYLNLGGAFGGGQPHEPHTLVAGATGSGKSVLIQAIILDIAATNPSALAQIYLIDPKMGVDYAAVERLPHVQGGVVVEQDRAVAVMEALVAEMERRYELFRAHGARDIRSFNVKASAKDRLPMMFLIHDEFAEWMLTEDYKAAVTANVSRLGVKARAAGIHLVFAAQRPDANVMPMQLRDNLGNRLILKVASIGTSEIALGVKGAEQLLGLGHLAARLSGEPSVVFAQAPFLSDEDIELAVDAIATGDKDFLTSLDGSR
ncbi:FtsK/SpoIIIE domain-containing protein [Mesorhizobium sp. M0019]|uniref:FtsK/SpoIIIE domain-containing protein n=1 Tax=Mesorhizobium sp. M0019 TaxID=2956845 RepID=UPI00333695AA